MKILSAKQIRNMDLRERDRTLVDLREELMMLYSSQTGGGISDNPAKAKMLRKQIARILTINNEEKLEISPGPWIEEEEEWEEVEEEEEYRDEEE
ncbi:MAG: 50S ribosomal protein L29 [Promethearchaeota archaeon]|nr:MAG: 50S ribosomal protein L29 [Candidatus Lokiarchaeota archaeon]